MNKLIIANAATEGGALSILNMYYNEYSNDCNSDNKYFFIVSIKSLKDTSNIKIIRYKFLNKKNKIIRWLMRIMFDKIFIKRIIKINKIDVILSLHNMALPNIKIPQDIYLHQSLPFVEYKFTIFKNFNLWIYQNIIGKIIIKRLHLANTITVQTHWMKDKIVRLGYDINKIYVTSPKITIENTVQRIATSEKVFIYPASPLIYKNHKVVIDALIYLKNNDFDFSFYNLRFLFTCKGDETKLIKKLKKNSDTNSLPIEWIGSVPKNIVFDYYRKCSLVFPSYIETFGLPLLEAKEFGCDILAADTLFAKEILENYDKVKYFPFDDHKYLANLIRNIINDSFIFKL